MVMYCVPALEAPIIGQDLKRTHLNFHFASMRLSRSPFKRDWKCIGMQVATIGADFNETKRDRLYVGFGSYISDLPVFSHAQKGTIAIVEKFSSSSGSDEGSTNVQFILLRCVSGKGRLVNAKILSM